MPLQPSVENNFTKGLVTEYTGLNFPENACTETYNCVFDTHGVVSRRPGIDLEAPGISGYAPFSGNQAINTFKWKNAGDGSTEFVVAQIGPIINFYKSSSVTEALPLTNTRLVQTVNLNNYIVSAGTESFECNFTAGNGFLFIFHQAIVPLYCSYSGGVISVNPITIQIRDFIGSEEGNVSVNSRPTSLTDPHSYNLANQGWTSAAAWSTTSTTGVDASIGSKVLTVAGGLPIVGGQNINIRGDYFFSTGPGFLVFLGGTVTSYVGTTLTVNITSSTNPTAGANQGTLLVTPINLGLLNTWNTAEGNYPSNADVWWRFKDNSGVFNPSTTAPNVTLGSGPANKGFYILDAFNLDRSAVSSVPNLTVASTNKRPRIGTWFQGRVWYSGVDAFSPASGNAKAYNWTENIYFSQIVSDPSQFGYCYQNNDPTDEQFFDLLPTDGGVIVIQGSGKIQELVPIQNGLIVRAENGVYFITGSQGIGFAANDYTITKISDRPSISSHSVLLEGFPIFWNEEGIYYVHPSQQGGGLVVENLCTGTIQSFFAQIPTVSKKYARGDYDPINYEIKWIYRSTAEAGLSDRYMFDRVLNFNTDNKAFYPYSVATDVGTIRDIIYLTVPGDVTSPAPTFKYFGAWTPSYVGFFEENDTTNWKDFVSVNGTGQDYTSYFITGYKLHGQGITKFQPVYVQMYSNSTVPTSYKINGIWDFANSPNSGKHSTVQQITNALGRFGVTFRRHKIRGSGYSLQFKIQSVTGMPFEIIGWTSLENKNTSV